MEETKLSMIEMDKENNFNNIFLRSWHPFAWIVLLGFIIYFSTLFFGFSFLDDNTLILDNSSFLSHLSNIIKAFQTDVFNSTNGAAFYYRPILTISFIFDYQIGGVFPFIYHFTNIILHLVSSCLVFVFLTKLNYKKILSFFFAIIFLVHPVLTQAVSWIPGRNDSLLAVFVLATSIFFINYLNNKKRSDLFWSLIFLGISLFTKESGILIIPILFFYLYFINRDKGEKIKINKFHFFFWSIGIIGLWFLLRNIALSGSASMAFSEMIKSVFINFPAVIQFIGKIFFPFNLSVLPVIQDTTFIYGIISIILLFILLFITKRKRWNFILFGIGWFFAFLLPSFIRPNTDIIADFIQHRLYVPIIGIFIILLETDLIRKINFNKKKTLIILGSIILFLGVINIFYSMNFKDKLSFWKNAVENSPHYPLAHRNLGAMEYLDGDMDNAEKESRIALELNPQEQMAHNNLGLIYVNKGMPEEAEIEYKKEIENNPYYDNVYFNLGLLYFNQKKYDDAVVSWKKTLEINPNHTDAIKALFGYYYDKKDYGESAPYANYLYLMGFTLPSDVLRTIQLSTIK